MRCPNCGIEIPEGSTTCPNCGAVLQALPVYGAPPDNGAGAYGAVQTPPKSNTKKIIIVVTVAAILLVSALAAVLLMSGGSERTMTYKEFICQYDHDGDGRPDSGTPKDFHTGDKVRIRDFAVNVTYNSSYDMSIILCKSVKDYYEARGDYVPPMIAKGDMSQYKGRDFTYEYTFEKYTENGETYVLPEELYLMMASMSNVTTHIILPMSFSTRKTGDTNWTLDIASSANGAYPSDLSYSIMKDDGTYLVYKASFPSNSGIMDANGIMWYDFNGDEKVDSGDAIRIDSSSIQSGYEFSISGEVQEDVTVQGSTMLP